MQSCIIRERYTSAMLRTLIREPGINVTSIQRFDVPPVEYCRQAFQDLYTNRCITSECIATAKGHRVASFQCSFEMACLLAEEFTEQNPTSRSFFISMAAALNMENHAHVVKGWLDREFKSNPEWSEVYRLNCWGDLFVLGRAGSVLTGFHADDHLFHPGKDSKDLPWLQDLVNEMNKVAVPFNGKGLQESTNQSSAWHKAWSNVAKHKATNTEK